MFSSSVSLSTPSVVMIEEDDENVDSSDEQKSNCSLEFIKSLNNSEFTPERRM